MSKTLNIFRHFMLAGCLVLLFGLTGCSSDDATTAVSSTGNALPQPSVDCGGSSCLD